MSTDNNNNNERPLQLQKKPFPPPMKPSGVSDNTLNNGKTGLMCLDFKLVETYVL
jgi:hypothetical protein